MALDAISPRTDARSRPTGRGDWLRLAWRALWTGSLPEPPHGPDDPGARSFLPIFVWTAFGFIALFYALVLLLDPYDRGTGLIAKTGTLEKGPRTANVSRGRDPAFTSAVIGNSHAQLLSPERLSAATGLAFVQLSTPGTFPDEHLFLLDYFASRHAAPGAVVIGADNLWCSGDPAMRNSKAYPEWLYGPVSDYLRGIVRFDTVPVFGKRIALLAGWKKRLRPDGYWDYESQYGTTRAGLQAAIEKMRGQQQWWPTATHPWVDRLGEHLAKLPPETVAIIYVPPYHWRAMADRAPAEKAAERACVAAFQAMAAKRPRTVVLDWRNDRPESHVDENFWDSTHYAQPMAQAVEKEMAAAINAAGRSRLYHGGVF